MQHKTGFAIQIWKQTNMGRKMKRVVLFLFLPAAVAIICYGNQMTAYTTANSGSQQCSEGWKITGYFTPVEADYPKDVTKEITVRGSKLNFSERFLRAVITEG